MTAWPDAASSFTLNSIGGPFSQWGGVETVSMVATGNPSSSSMIQTVTVSLSASTLATVEVVRITRNCSVDSVSMSSVIVTRSEPVALAAGNVKVPELST